ncbi:hypothetical protein NDU88_005709 [Pleurodeles waltl]|uniref:Uncharacterized protein n=1 Tax=Pleurodeles waltl TaxID=8319 RepID=A0AAV7N210_PLEWA|nr:hypothetical protein NDU88_005709 [Pleurodeles waltl]
MGACRGSLGLVKAGDPQSMHHQETVENAGRMRRYNIAGSRLATLLRFCRRPGAVSSRSLVEVEEGDAEELWASVGPRRAAEAARLAETARRPYRHSDFPAGPAGDRQKAARWPSGKAPSTMKPAPNGAGGVERVRRVQLHPLRFSVSARQTLKIIMGPCLGAPALPMTVAWAVQGPHNTRSRHPVPGGFYRQDQDGGKGVGIPMAVLQAAPPWRILWGRGKPSGNHRLPFSDRGFTAGVRIAHEAPPACWRCFRGTLPWQRP